MGQNILKSCRGKKITCPRARASKILIRTSIYFHPMSDGQVYSARLHVFEWSALFGNRTSKNLGVLVHRTGDHFKKFFTPV